MVLFYCPNCHDVLKIMKAELRSCNCGKSSGRYDIDGSSIVLFGESVSIRFDNTSLKEALTYRETKGKEKKFDAYVTSIKYGRIMLKSNDK